MSQRKGLTVFNHSERVCSGCSIRQYFELNLGILHACRQSCLIILPNNMKTTLVFHKILLYLDIVALKVKRYYYKSQRTASFVKAMLSDVLLGC